MNLSEIKDYIHKDYLLRNHHHFMNSSKYEIEVLIDPHLICKATDQVESDQSLNDTLQYWVEVLIPVKINWDDETSKYAYPEGQVYTLAHDIDLDCGGYTYEEAILNAYELMIKKYGPTSEELIDNKFKSLFK